jgi:hypothetical protein
MLTSKCEQKERTGQFVVAEPMVPCVDEFAEFCGYRPCMTQTNTSFLSKSTLTKLQKRRTAQNRTVVPYQSGSFVRD